MTQPTGSLTRQLTAYYLNPDVMEEQYRTVEEIAYESFHESPQESTDPHYPTPLFVRRQKMITKALKEGIDIPQPSKLMWSRDNTIPDIYAIIDGTYDPQPQQWIPVFTGENFLDFLQVFQKMRMMLQWNEATSRAYLLRSFRPPALQVRDHIQEIPIRRHDVLLIDLLRRLLQGPDELYRRFPIDTTTMW